MKRNRSIINTKSVGRKPKRVRVDKMQFSGDKSSGSNNGRGSIRKPGISTVVRTHGCALCFCDFSKNRIVAYNKSKIYDMVFLDLMSHIRHKLVLNVSKTVGRCPKCGSTSSKDPQVFIVECGAKILVIPQRIFSNGVAFDWTIFRFKVLEKLLCVHRMFVISSSININTFPMLRVLVIDMANTSGSDLSELSKAVNLEYATVKRYRCGSSVVIRNKKLRSLIFQDSSIFRINLYNMKTVANITISSCRILKNAIYYINRGDRGCDVLKSRKICEKNFIRFKITMRDSVVLSTSPEVYCRSYRDMVAVVKNTLNYLHCFHELVFSRESPIRIIIDLGGNTKLIISQYWRIRLKALIKLTNFTDLIDYHMLQNQIDNLNLPKAHCEM